MRDLLGARRFLALAFALLAGAVAALSAAAEVTPHPGMLRNPDISATHIVFVYADDLWLVPREGGTATPLASPAGREELPRFSPDGGTIAFVGNYDGDRDLYTVPVSGGVPHRVTYHPANEFLSDWTPDGRLIFFARGLGEFPRAAELFTVDAAGGLPEKMPVPYGTFASVSPDGRWLAYTPLTRDFRTWKRYMGGWATDIWLFDLQEKSSKRVTDWGGTDSQPMWHGPRLFYLSDAGKSHRLNLWVYDRETGKSRQITRFDDYDVKWPAIGPGSRGEGEIVFQNGAHLYVMPLDTEEPRQVTVTIPGARPTLRTRSVDASKYIQSWAISPTGKRAALGARGDVWTAPAKKGSPRNLTRTSGAAERSPAWSPDGRWIAYFSDESGEYELYITQSDGKGETRKLTATGAEFKLDPLWSPDSKHIVFQDQTGGLYLHTLEDGETKTVDKDPTSNDLVPASPSWSHDSRWLAYARAGDETLTSSVWIYSVEDGEKRRVTSEMFNDSSPRFDRKGYYLFFQSNRHFSPYYSDVDTTFIYADSEVILAVPLLADQPSPWAPESDEETWEDDEEEEAEGGDGAEEGGAEEEGEEAPEAEDDGVSGTWEGTITGEELPPGGMPFTLNLVVDPDGSCSGSISVPGGSATIDSGTYDFETGDLRLTVTADDGSIWEIVGRVSGSTVSGTATNTTAGLSAELTASRTATLAEAEEAGGEEEKARETVEIDFAGFEGRALMLPIPPGNFGLMGVNDKNHLIYARLPMRGSDGQASIKIFDLKDEKKEEKEIEKGAGAFAVSADGKMMLVVRGGSGAIRKAAPGDAGKPVVTKGMTAWIDPREEWTQILRDAWRIQRDYFYDPGMHGVDWDAVYGRYEAMLEDCATRRDVGYVIGEMIAELNVGHAYYGGGDFDDQEPSTTVGLLGVDFELHQGAYRIARIYQGAPWDVDARGPLSQPGVEVAEGDYLLAVNGVPLSAERDPWSAFQDKAGQNLTLTVSAEPVLDEEARELVVHTLGNDASLRYRAWIERNRAYVQEKSGGRVGYIYVPNTGVDGQNDLIRQYSGQLHEEALIIDERWNGGGQIPTRFIEMLNRPITNYWARPHGRDWPWPPDAHQGPKCMLINGAAGSGGDAFPAYFRQAGLGKLVGMRTWGGLVGISGNPQLIDGARMTVPTFGYYESDGTWGIEGYGVAPDIEVVDDPAKMVGGGDPQLDAAIDLMLEELRRNPYEPPRKPAYPDRSGMGVTKADR